MKPIKKESAQKGWVVINIDGAIVDFTFSITRAEAQKKWVDLWSKPNNWKAHYRKGVRCVKAKRLIIKQK